MDYFLTVKSKNGTGETIRVEEGETIVGRSKTATFTIDDKYVSREHLRIMRTGNEVIVENLSRFGTRLDGKPLDRPAVMCAGQEIQLTRVLTLSLEGRETEEDLESEELEADGDGDETIVVDVQSMSEESMDLESVDVEPEDVDEVQTDAREVVESETSDIAQQAAKTASRQQKIRKLRVPAVLHLSILGAVLLLFVVLNLAIPNETWANAFLFERGVVQWITIYIFVFGLVLLGRRCLRLVREERSLALLRDGRLERGVLRMVSLRFRRLHARLQRGKDPGIWPYAKDLAERDENELESSYGTVMAVIQVLPLIGFFGTVLGLSRGLYRSFVVIGGASSTATFGQAIGTAFDTTLLALACTIVVIIGQRLLRQKDESLLTRLNAFVDDYIEDAVPTHGEDEGGKLPDEVVRSIETILRETSAQVAQEAKAAFGDVGKSMADEAKGTFQGVSKSMAEAVDAQLSAMSKKIAEDTDAQRQGLAEAGLSAVEAIREKLGEAGDAALAAIAEKQAGIGPEELDKLAERFEASVGELAERLDGLREAQPSAEQEDPVPDLLKELKQSLDELKAGNAESVRKIGEDVRIALEDLDGRMADLAKQDLALTEGITSSMSSNIKALAQRLERVLSRPRRINFVEKATVLPDDESTGDMTPGFEPTDDGVGE